MSNEKDACRTVHDNGIDFDDDTKKKSNRPYMHHTLYDNVLLFLEPSQCVYVYSFLMLVNMRTENTLKQISKEMCVASECGHSFSMRSFFLWLSTVRVFFIGISLSHR